MRLTLEDDVQEADEAIGHHVKGDDGYVVASGLWCCSRHAGPRGAGQARRAGLEAGAAGQAVYSLERDRIPQPV